MKTRRFWRHFIAKYVFNNSEAEVIDCDITPVSRYHVPMTRALKLISYGLQHICSYAQLQLVLTHAV